MSHVSSTLCWFLSNGWILDENNNFSKSPSTDFSIESLLDCSIDDHLSRTILNLDSIVLPYCEKNISKYVKCLKKSIT